VKPATGKTVDHELWVRYADELLNLIQKMQTGKRREAQLDLARRVGSIFQALPSDDLPLLPIDIEIENPESERYTLLRISAPDTVGFVYEFSNALALSHINIVRMSVKTIGARAEDTLFVTDEKGGKITDPEKQRELRAATVLIKHFTHLLPTSPNPESALLHFREFLHQLFERPNWVDEFASIERPEVLNALARLLGVSEFLWDDFLRMQYSNLFPIVRDVNALEKGLDKHQLEVELKKNLEQATNPREALNAFKDKQIFRVDMRHILGHTSEFWDFSAELTDLVEVVLTCAHNLCFGELVQKYGSPRLESGRECRCTILALGKCGGRELGFASDIELMFIYEGQGKTNGPKGVPNSQFFEEWVRAVEKTIQARQEGTFHLDLQLRPYGKAGSLAVSLEAFKKYYTPDGPAWPYERQSLVKARPIVGDVGFGEILTGLRDDFIYTGTPFDITAMRAMRERQVRHLTSAGTFNAKFSPGGLVDLEYLVQGLQIDHGAEDAGVRQTNIRAAMSALHAGGYLSTSDYDRLRKAHTFLRWLIDSLRVVRGNARDVNIPEQQGEEFAYLARRLKYGSDLEQLRLDLVRYPQDVLDLSLKLFPIS
jgi:glutamate-ammonia-ligase adenylyltransferase